MKVLAIETSCDETAAAIIEGDGTSPNLVRANVVYSQIDIHRQYGGVYPEAASREHVKKIGPVIEETLGQYVSAINQGNNHNLQGIIRDEIDAIAVTAGPGLIGALLVGVHTAKALAYGFGKPLIGINHHAGHILAAWLKPDDQPNFQVPTLPAVALVVSGGHTQLIWMRDERSFEVIGRTRDDAAGEAFDKVARLMGLPYPGGPAIEQLAKEYAEKKPITNTLSSLKLPRPMLDSGNFAFSFSGLKTAVATVVARQGEMDATFRANLAYEFQEAVVDVLVTKTLQAVAHYHPASVIVVGGVAASRRLRDEMGRRLGEAYPTLPLHIPPIKYCTDNAAMIGSAAIFEAVANQVHNWYDVQANENWMLG